MQKRKLIEVALPLETINRESAREKSIRHGHPSTLHLWWARRPSPPLGPSCSPSWSMTRRSHPTFPTEELQRAERERLHRDHRAARRLGEHARSRAACRGARGDPQVDGRQSAADPRPVRRRRHDPSRGAAPRAGGPRLRPEPGRRADQQGAHRNPAKVPGTGHPSIPASPIADSVAGTARPGWPPMYVRTASGCATRPRSASAITTRQQRYRTDSKATVIAWIWARTVTCPNPACGISRCRWSGVGGWARRMAKRSLPSRQLCLTQTTRRDHAVQFELRKGKDGPKDGTVSGRTGGVCVACDGAASVDYLRKEGRTGRIGQQLLAVVADGGRQRIYVPASSDQELAASVEPPVESIRGEIADNPRWFSPPAYGLTEFADLFMLDN